MKKTTPSVKKIFTALHLYYLAIFVLLIALFISKS